MPSGFDGSNFDDQEDHVAKDPVCNMTIDEKSAAGKSEYKAKTYYFCSAGCKTKFDENPPKYAGA